MQALSSTGFLDLWERGQRLHPLDQGLLALSVALPDTAADALADLPLGERNRVLAEWRSACFGAHLGGCVACPGCGDTLQFELDCLELAATQRAARQTAAHRELNVDGQKFRLPSSRDLALAARATDAAEAARLLLERCRLCPIAEPWAWSAEQVQAIGEQMALADPLAETRLELACSGCGHQWEELLDLAAFLWSEIEVKVHRLLREVHALASAYGWSEAEILALSEERRARYLELVGA
jgi:hypothetical protein